jgi:predicted Zn finger-like uncharacterized protein
MFTVCPKCALTLVVTATDLRVAQGYVRCGRCSNVFNALARLSEDRNAAAAAAASQGVPPSSTGVHPRPQPTAVPPAPPQPSQTPARPPLATGSFTYTRPPESPAPTARPPQPPSGGPAASQPHGTPGSYAQSPESTTARPGTPSTRAQQPGAPSTRAPQGVSGQSALPAETNGSAAERSQVPAGRPPSSTAAPPQTQQPAATPTPPPPSRLAPPPPLETAGDDDDVIPEDALEFNPDAADVNQVFIEPPPNPEWTAATGSFKAIVLKSEEVFHGAGPATARDPTAADDSAAAAPAGRPASTEPSSQRSGLSSTFGDDEFELDADFLSATAEMRKLKVGLGDADSGTGAGIGAARKPPATGGPQAPPPSALQPQIAPSAKLAPRGPAATEAQSQPRSSPAEIQWQPRPSSTEAQSQPQARPSAGAQSAPRPSAAEAQSRPQAKSPPPGPGEEPFFEPQVFEPQVVSRPPPRAAVKAFGLDAAVEPPPERLAALARSRIAPGAIELEPPLPRTLLNSATLWSAGAGALLILLAAQIVNHYRNDLAATARFNKPITALYAALGMHLTPRWDLHAYDVRQLGASVDSASAGQIMVRASVKNGAHQPQPMPLLRVTLQDRFGNRIAARDVPPGSYLPRATAGTAFLPAGQRIDAEMAFVDPGSNAVGFEIDACLPSPAGGIACANDPTSR